MESAVCMHERAPTCMLARACASSALPRGLAHCQQRSAEGSQEVDRRRWCGEATVPAPSRDWTPVPAARQVISRLRSTARVEACSRGRSWVVGGRIWTIGVASSHCRARYVGSKRISGHEQASRNGQSAESGQVKQHHRLSTTNQLLAAN